MVSKKMGGSWDFLKDGTGIMPASNLAQPLRGTDLTASDILIRESVQNSLDEIRTDIERLVRIVVESESLLGKEKAKFVQSLGLDDISKRSQHFNTGHNWFTNQGKDVLSQIHNPKIPLPIIKISDYYTNGLGGYWNRRKSREDRFFNLVLSIGESPKWSELEDENQTLGSYGFGKMAFAMCSNIRTIIYYSTFLPTPASGQVTARAMATGFFPNHTVDGTDYAGQAYWGMGSSEPQNPREPLTDSDAHDWIKSLGFKARRRVDTGTTVIIPAASVEIDDVYRSFIKWWWPRLLDQDPRLRVDCEFVRDGTPMPPPDPRLENPVLSHFADCYKQMKSDDVGEGYKSYDIRVKPRGLRQLLAGRLILKSLNLEPQEGTLINSVALIRNGLVIKYDQSFAHEDKSPVVGVFVPEPKQIKAFVFSEPAAHDDWKPNNDRLEPNCDWGGDFLRLVLNRLKVSTREFQIQCEDRPKTEHQEAGAFLERTIGKIFKKMPSGGGGGNDRSSRAITISCHKAERNFENGSCEDHVQYEIGLSNHANVDDATLRVSIMLIVLADADGKFQSPVECQIIDQEGEVLGKGTPANVDVEASKGFSNTVFAKAHVHPVWKTAWRIDVAKQEGNE